MSEFAQGEIVGIIIAAAVYFVIWRLPTILSRPRTPRASSANGVSVTTRESRSNEIEDIGR